MTKQEKIQEAYGIRYEFLKDFINTDGVFVGNTDLINDDEFNQWDFIGKAKNTDVFGKEYVSGSRPECLRGISDNKGWTNIYSKLDLPKTNKKSLREGIQYHVVMKKNKKVFPDALEIIELHSFYDKGWISHYKPIIIPEPPLY